MVRFTICLLLAFAVPIPVSAADQNDPKKPAIDEKDAGPEFALQGEYAGSIKAGDEELKLGVQVIALGDGKFRAVAYPGGLPGDGWNREHGRHEADGTLQNGVVTFVNNDAGSGEIRDGRLQISVAGVQVGDLPRVVRKSPTLGKRAPEGAVILFDGSTADTFEGGRLSDDKLLMEGCTSKEKFQDFTLHVEFLLSFMPYASGQGRSNSGCYMQGRYEVQMLDSFGLEGKNNECGGLYTIKDPDVNMCFPPLSWQTYDVDFTAAKYDESGKKTANGRMTVRHNGVVVHDNVELPHGTTAHPVKEGPEPGPIYFQNHGNPVRYRNIWVVPKQS